MGGSQSYHEPPWSLEDARVARPLSTELREKLLGLDYRVRKCLGRYGQEEDDRRDADGDDEDEQREGENHICVGYHTEGVPESLDKVRIVAAKFTIDLDDLKRRCERRITHCRSTAHSVILDPPVVELPAGTPSIPRVKVEVCFAIAEVVPTQRLYRKASVGNDGMHTLGVNLLITASACDAVDDSRVEQDSVGGTDDECSDDGSGTDDDMTEAWHVPVVVGFAASEAFDGRVDAESENGQERRWWGQKEHSRQQATVPLSRRVLHPRGPFAPNINEGRSILDLNLCVPKKLDIDALWKAEGCSRSSAQALWAAFSRCYPRAAVATPLGRRRHSSRSPGTPLETVSSCRDVVKIIAAFTLEPSQYTFEADIHFGLGICNF
eukprot:TRINITY_DN13404_c0_g1_i1.p1 TRINITY_DN13404_c0_g1~~TRINITY_DN13404_c0_g1_i1.p1  ORF type:complete len:380 (-),score=69.01 TRINITY_DN13404_c0_g1_i1:310-1449(-)